MKAITARTSSYVEYPRGECEKKLRLPPFQHPTDILETVQEAEDAMLAEVSMRKRLSITSPTQEMIEQEVIASTAFKRSNKPKFAVDSFIEHVAGANRCDGRARIGKYDKAILKVITDRIAGATDDGSLHNLERAFCIVEGGVSRLVYRIKVLEILKMVRKKDGRGPSRHMWKRFSRLLREQGYIGMVLDRRQKVDLKTGKPYWVTDAYLWVEWDSLFIAMSKLAVNAGFFRLAPDNDALTNNMDGAPPVSFCSTAIGNLPLSPDSPSSPSTPGDDSRSAIKNLTTESAFGGSGDQVLQKDKDLAKANVPKHLTRVWKTRTEWDEVLDHKSVPCLGDMPDTPELRAEEERQQLPFAERLYRGDLDIDTRRLLAELHITFNFYLENNELRVTNGLLKSLADLQTPRFGPRVIMPEKVAFFRQCQEYLPFWMHQFEGDHDSDATMTIGKFLDPKVWLAIDRKLSELLYKGDADIARFHLQEMEGLPPKDRTPSQYDPDHGKSWAEQAEDGVNLLATNPTGFLEMLKRNYFNCGKNDLPSLLLYGQAVNCNARIVSDIQRDTRNYFASTPEAAMYFHLTHKAVDWATVTGMTENFAQAVHRNGRTELWKLRWIVNKEELVEARFAYVAPKRPQWRSRSKPMTKAQEYGLEATTDELEQDN